MQNTVFYTCRRPFGSGGQSRSSAPASSRRRGGAGGRAPLVRGEGGEWRSRVSSGGGPSAGAAGLEFPSKGIRRELEGCWKYCPLCRHILQPSLWDCNDNCNLAATSASCSASACFGTIWDYDCTLQSLPARACQHVAPQSLHPNARSDAATDHARDPRRRLLGPFRPAN